MTAADRLDRLRAEVPGCDIAVLADLSTETVLTSSAEVPQGQEKLDALVARAAALLRGPIGEGAALLLEGEPEYPERALFTDGRRLEAFVTGPTDRPEALVCVAGADGEASLIFDCAARALGDILRLD